MPRKTKCAASTFPARLREARIQVGLTQEALAKSIGLERRQDIMQLESRKQPKTLETIEKLARALGVSPGWLAGWEE